MEQDPQLVPPRVHLQPTHPRHGSASPVAMAAMAAAAEAAAAVAAAAEGSSQRGPSHKGWPTSPSQRSDSLGPHLQTLEREVEMNLSKHG